MIKSARTLVRTDYYIRIGHFCLTQGLFDAVHSPKYTTALMKHRRPAFTLLAFALRLLLLAALLLPSAAAPLHAQTAPANVQAIFNAMTAADRVGQLFVVTFNGSDAAADSAIAGLIRDFRIGGVLLSAANNNFRNTTPDGALADTPQQVARLTNQLQALAFDGSLPFEVSLAPQPEDLQALDTPPERGVTLPLLIGVSQDGNGYPGTSLRSGFSPLPGNMALGAGWSVSDAAAIGYVTGSELADVGVNLLLGPALDVLDNPRPDPATTLGVRSFGGNAYWVGRLGRAFIGGVHEGSAKRVATIAKHFPGQGSSDRAPENEVATIQKPAATLAEVEIAPFAAAARPGTLQDLLPGSDPPRRASTVTDGLQSTHIRYAGLQGNSENAPPISLAPQLTQELLDSPAFSDWHTTRAGVVMSDELGAPAVRRYYDPTLQSFPHRRVAQDALLAGNDLLLLARWSLDDSEATAIVNIKDTITFFQSKYTSDADFRRRVDAAVLRILTLKVRLYPELDLYSVLVDGEKLATRDLREDVGAQAARDAVTLLAPSNIELAQRLPTGPGPDDFILFISDARQVRECLSDDCPPFPLIAPTALQDIVFRLYEPSGRVAPERMASLTLAQLAAWLNPPEPAADGTPVAAVQPEQAAPSIAEPDIAALIAEADWIVFAILDNSPQAAGVAVMRQFLSEKPVSREQKRLVAIAYDAPYFLDATDIAKLTAYFAVYGHTQPLLEASMRVLFREWSPTGASPVDISALNYALSERLQPNPRQFIPMSLPDVRVQMGSNTFTAKVGDTLRVLAGPILDNNGRIVPDNTAASFKLKQRTDQFELPLGETRTLDGFAESSVVLERAGDYEVQVQSGQASGSLSLLLNILDSAQGEAQVAVATATPSPVPTETPAPTPAPTEIPAPTPVTEGDPSAGDDSNAGSRRVNAVTFALALAAVALVVLGVLRALRSRLTTRADGLRLSLWMASGGALAYLLYGLGWFPAANWLHSTLHSGGAALAALVGSLLPVLALRSKE